MNGESWRPEKDMLHHTGLAWGLGEKAGDS